MTPSEAQPPSLPSPALDEDLLCRQLVAGGAEAAARELLEVAGLERAPHVAELRAELRPQDGEVRLDVQLARVDRSEARRRCTRSSLGDLVRVRLRARRALDDERG